jgi:tetratricopeptide (TPR) repeat protein
MQKRRFSLFTKVFLFALILLACSFAVSFLVWLLDFLLQEYTPLKIIVYSSIAAFLLLAFCIIPYHMMSFKNRVLISKKVVLASFLAYLAAVLIIFIPVVYFISIFFPKIAQGVHDPKASGLGAYSFAGFLLNGFQTWLWPMILHPASLKSPGLADMPPWIMAAMTLFLALAYALIDISSIYLSKHRILSPVRLVFLMRFSLFGNLIRWLESGWRPIVVRLMDVLLFVLIIQAFINRLWSYHLGPLRFTDEVIANLTYFGGIFSNGAPLNGTPGSGIRIITVEVPNDHLVSWIYSDYNFAFGLVADIFAVIWFQWETIVIIWFILEITVFFWTSSQKLVIEDASANETSAQSNDNEKGKQDSTNGQSQGLDLASLLAVKLDRIGHVYEVVNEKRAIKSACGVGEPIDAAIKVDSQSDLSFDTSSQISMGPLSVPAKSIASLVSNLLGRPRIMLRLQKGSQDASVNRKDGGINGIFFLIANKVDKKGSKSWVVDCQQPLEADSSVSRRSIEDMITEMSQRIFTSLTSERTGIDIPWRAMWNFNEGLRAYRDGLNTPKREKFFLKQAEKRFIKAVEDYSSFSLAYYNLGVVYTELNNLDSAEDCFQKAIKIDPGGWEAYYAQGLVIYKRAREQEQLIRSLGLYLFKTEDPRAQWFIHEYKRVINLADRVLEMRLRDAGSFEKDYATLAKAYDLKGNAWSCLARIECYDRNDDCPTDKSRKEICIHRAMESLENAAYYSWRALIEESKSKDVTNNAAKIVRDCSLDLADLYLKLGENKKCSNKFFNYWSHAKPVLILALYANPDEISLYHLLAKANLFDDNLYEKKSISAEDIYKSALRISPENSRLMANLRFARQEVNSEEKELLKECEESHSCDSAEYDMVYNHLVDLLDIDKEKRLDGGELRSIKQEKLMADLQEAFSKEVKLKSFFQRDLMGLSSEDSPDVILAIGRFLKEKGGESLSYKCISHAYKVLLKKLEISEPESGANLQLEIPQKYYKIDNMRLLDDFLILGSLFTQLSTVKFAESAKKNYISPECFLVFANQCFDIICGNINKQSAGTSLFHIQEYSLYLAEIGKRYLEMGMIEQSQAADFEKSSKNSKDNIEKSEEVQETASCTSSTDKLNLQRVNAGNSSENTIKHFKNAEDYFRRAKKILEKAEETIKYCDGSNLICPRKNLLRLDETAANISDNIVMYLYCVQRYSLCLEEVGKGYLKMGEIEQSQGADAQKSFENAQGCFEKAIAILEMANNPEEVKRNKIRSYLAKTYLKCGKSHEALEEAQKARRLNPLDHEERILLGRIFCKLKEYKFGIEELDYALSWKPDDPDILFELGRTYFKAALDCKNKEQRKSLLEKAKEHLEEAFEIHDKSEIKERGKIRYWIGGTLLAMGAYEKAIPHFRILAEKEKNLERGAHSKYLPLSDLWLGYSYLKINAHEEAEVTLSKLVKEYSDKENQNYEEFLGSKTKIKEILSRACIYLAYSYVERDANLDIAWKWAHKTQGFIEQIREENSVSYHGANKKEEDRPHCYSLEPSSKCTEYSDIISINCCLNDGPRKRKVKAHLAEVVGAILYKKDKIEGAIQCLEVSIALYPDAGAYLNLAKAYERKLSMGVTLVSQKASLDKSEKALINRKIQDLCLYVDKLDIKGEHAKDLAEFKKRFDKENSGQESKADQ